MLQWTPAQERIAATLGWNKLRLDYQKCKDFKELTTIVALLFRSWFESSRFTIRIENGAFTAPTATTVAALSSNGTGRVSGRDEASVGWGGQADHVRCWVSHVHISTCCTLQIRQLVGQAADEALQRRSPARRVHVGQVRLRQLSTGVEIGLRD